MKSVRWFTNGGLPYTSGRFLAMGDAFDGGCNNTHTHTHAHSTCDTGLVVWSSHRCTYRAKGGAVLLAGSVKLRRLAGGVDVHVTARVACTQHMHHDVAAWHMTLHAGAPPCVAYGATLQGAHDIRVTVSVTYCLEPANVRTSFVNPARTTALMGIPTLFSSTVQIPSYVCHITGALGEYNTDHTATQPHSHAVTRPHSHT